MRSIARIAGAAGVAAASVIVMTGCATPDPAGDAPVGDSLGSTHAAPPAGDVTAQGTVMDVGGVVELCLGAIAESYPPQCTGLPLEGWTWDGIDGSESSGDVTWGAYAVQGAYDGSGFTLTQPPVMLALYDPAPIEDPTGGEPGTADATTLAAIQDELPDRLGPDLLSSSTEKGRVWVDVIWDDGTWQAAADDDFGADVVVIRSALRPVG